MGPFCPIASGESSPSFRSKKEVKKWLLYDWWQIWSHDATTKQKLTEKNTGFPWDGFRVTRVKVFCREKHTKNTHWEIENWLQSGTWRVCVFYTLNLCLLFPSEGVQCFKHADQKILYIYICFCWGQTHLTNRCCCFVFFLRMLRLDDMLVVVQAGCSRWRNSKVWSFLQDIMNFNEHI